MPKASTYYFNAYLIVLMSFLLINVKINAQKYPFHHYDAENGLPSSDIFHVFQDSKGYIWVATDNGVSRFNGSEFINYSIKDGLTKNTILEIFEDNKQRIWFISIDASISYYEDGKIYPYKYNNLLKESIKKKTIPVKYSFFVDSIDNLMISIENRRIKVIDKKGENINILPEKELNKYNFIIEKKNKLIMHYYQGNLSDSILYIHNHQKNVLYIKKLPHKFIKHFTAVKLNNNRIFIALENKIYEFENYFLKKIHKFDEKLYWIQKDSHNNLWIAGNKGGVKCFYNGIIKEKPDIYFLKDHFIASIIEDDRGGYWFASLHSGVYYLPDLNLRYFDKSNFLYKNIVNAIYASNDSIWVAYPTNYVSLITKNKVKHIKIGNNQNLEITSLAYNKKNKELLVGSTQNLYVLKNNKIRKYLTKKIKEKYSSSLCTKDIAIDKNNEVWIAGREGFQHIKNGKLIFDSKIEQNFVLRNNAVYADDNHSVWIGSINGLWHFKNQYLEYLGSENPLLSIRVLDIIRYKNKLTLATKGGGIIIIDKDTILQINTNSGLKSDMVSSLCISDEYLWAGTKKGLSRILLKDNKKIEVYNYTKAHGLLSNEIRNIYAKDSFIYIAANKGLMLLNVKKIKKDSLPIPIYLKEILINNAKVSLQNEYKLKYNQNNIVIKFETISFNKKETEYRYIMSGLDSIYTLSKSKELRFSFLPPGKYTFELTAKNKDELWNSNPLTISFIIEKPFWQTTWFIFTVFFSIFILVYVIYKYKTIQLNKKNEMQRELNIYLKQALVNHMNPHFMFNTLSRINNYILKNEKEKATEFLHKFSLIMRVIIENSKKEYIPIYEELKANRMYLELESHRMEHKLEYKFIIDKEIDQFKTKVPSLLLQPFIENAIWYGIQPLNKNGKIIVHIKMKEKNISIEIQDNGIGRKKTIEMIKNNEVYNNQSKGTEISSKRIQLIEQIYGSKTKIEYIDLAGKEKGTLVIINLPILK